MKNKNSKIIALAFAILIIIVGYKFIVQKKDNELAEDAGSLIFEVGSIAKKGKDKFALEIPIIEEKFKASGLKLKIRQVLAGTNMLTDKNIKWNFSMSNTMVVLMQRRIGAPVEPLTWIKGCKQNAVAITQASNTSSLSDMANKKIIIFGFGYNTGTVLKAIKDWNLENAQLYHSTDGAMTLQLLIDQKIDMVISDANFYLDNKDSSIAGTDYEKSGSKILAETNYDTPCRIISYSSATVDAKTRDGFFNVLKSLGLVFSRAMVPVDKAEFDKLASSFDWAELDKINAKIEPFPINL